MEAIILKTEYLVNPIGIDIINPCFFWNCSTGVLQTAYHLIAEKNGCIVWDSGKVKSNSMTHIKYMGEELNSRDIINWKVKLWDENDIQGNWSESTFEMGLLNPDDWKANWISGDYTLKKNIRYPVDYFKKEFILNKKVIKARLYISALGLYEAKINGNKVGNFVLAPGCTDYRTRVQYQVYNVLHMLTSLNILEVELADGWYRGSIGAFGVTNVYGRQTKIICQLEIEFSDASTQTICSNNSFLWSNDGPKIFTDLKDGEIYNASFKPSYGNKALVVKEKLIPLASNNIYVKEHEIFSPKLIITPTGDKILDFGQNIAGYISFNVTGNKGDKILLRCGEILDINGEFTMDNIQLKKPEKEFGVINKLLLISGKTEKIKGKLVETPKQEISFYCSGNTDYYKTTFSVFGFRYVQLTTDVSVDPLQFSAIAVYSDLEQTGEFNCSNESINRFVENTRWSMKGNFLDLPIDCPTRERLGWTGDAQIFFNTSAYFMNVAPFYRKWMKDLIDGQFPNGSIPAVVPHAGLDMMYKSTGSSVGWADAIVLIPYRFWKIYGDVNILEDSYEAMLKFAKSVIKNTGMKNKKQAQNNPYNKYTYEKGMHLGEWLEPEDVRDSNIGYKFLHPEECTAYLHYTMGCLAEISNFLDKPNDEKLFREYSEGAKKAYNFLFLPNGKLDTDRQAKLVRPLALGLLDVSNKRAVEKRLVQAIENAKYCVGTGFLSTSFLLPMLSNGGFKDIAYKMLENEESPSWLSEVKAGATTVWENWDGKDSRNHYSPGSVCEWIFNTVGGINISSPGHFIIKVIPGGSLTFAKTKYLSIYGEVKSSWEKIGSGYSINITIPPNTTADVFLTNDIIEKIGSGSFAYKL